MASSAPDHKFTSSLKTSRGARSQVEAAAVCGVSIRTYLRWENGTTAPSAAEKAGAVTLLGREAVHPVAPKSGGLTRKPVSAPSVKSPIFRPNGRL